MVDVQDVCNLICRKEFNIGHIVLLVKMLYALFHKTETTTFDFRERMEIHTFFISNTFFNSASVLLNFFYELSFKCCLGVCLIHISIILLRHCLYFLHLCPCVVLGLVMSYLCNLFSFSSSFSL